MVRVEDRCTVGTSDVEVLERLRVRHRNQHVSATDPNQFRQGLLLQFIIEVLDDIGAHDKIHRVRRERQGFARQLHGREGHISKCRHRAVSAKDLAHPDEAVRNCAIPTADVEHGLDTRWQDLLDGDCHGLDITVVASATPELILLVVVGLVVSHG